MKRSSPPALRIGSLVFAFVTATFCVAACGGGPAASGSSDAKSPSTAFTSADPPRTLDEAQAQLASAEQHIFGTFRQDKLETQGRFATPPGATDQRAGTAATRPGESPPPPPLPTSNPMSPQKEAEARLPEGDAAAQSAGAGMSSSPCETACRALASMNRAATHICALAGDDSDSCTNARERVRAATERVRQSCSECNGS